MPGREVRSSQNRSERLAAATNPARVTRERWEIWNAQRVMSSDPGGTSRRDGAPRVNRLLALSDGVIAIALTLLV